MSSFSRSTRIWNQSLPTTASIHYFSPNLISQTGNSEPSFNDGSLIFIWPFFKRTWRMQTRATINRKNEFLILGSINSPPGKKHWKRFQFPTSQINKRKESSLSSWTFETGDVKAFILMGTRASAAPKRFAYNFHIIQKCLRFAGNPRRIKFLYNRDFEVNKAESIREFFCDW